MVFRDCSVKVTIFKFYLQHGETALHLAARFGRTDIIEILIQQGADINKADKVRINKAIQEHPNIIKTLIQHGADITAKDEVRVKH